MSDSDETGHGNGKSTASSNIYSRPVTPTPMPASPARFTLKPGEYLHDAACSETLVSFTRRVCSMNVYSLFFDHLTVISKDAKGPSAIGDQHPELNRFQDIKCIDTTRVKVPHSSGTHDYIHANYVDGFREEKKFILTQAPLENTAESFWAMIHQENVVEIVSLMVMDTKKCYVYMPIERNQQLKFGPYTIVHCGSQQIRETYDATLLNFKKSDGPVRKLLHICYHSWPAKGTPTRPSELLYVLCDMNANRKSLVEEAERSGWLKPDTISPIVIHCLTGCGRSGTVAALDICCRKMDHTEKLANGAVVDVRDTVIRLRTQRSMAVMKPEQYVYLHLVVIEYALRQKYYEDVDFIDLSNYTNST